MPHQDDSNGLASDIQFPEEGGQAWREVLELLAEQGFEGLAEAMQILLNEAMKLERSQALGARPYQRTARRQGYANGFQPKTVKTRIGALQLAVPKTRGMEFYPSALERGQRSERALTLALAEMRAPRGAGSARSLHPQSGPDPGTALRVGRDQHTGQPRGSEAG